MPIAVLKVNRDSAVLQELQRTLAEKVALGKLIVSYIRWFGPYICSVVTNACCYVQMQMLIGSIMIRAMRQAQSQLPVLRIVLRTRYSFMSLRVAL